MSICVKTTFVSLKLSVLFFEYNLQIKAVFILWFRRFFPGGLWKLAKATGGKGNDCGVTKDVSHVGWTGEQSLLTHSRYLAYVAVVLFEFSVN